MSLAPGAEAAVALDARGAVLGAHGVEVPDERDCAGRGPRVTRHDDRVAVAADRRGERRASPRRASTASQSARSSPMGDGIAQSQSSVSSRRRRSSARSARHTGTPKSRSAALRLTLRSVLARSLADDERARDAELAGGELLRAHAGDDDAARRARGRGARRARGPVTSRIAVDDVSTTPAPITASRSTSTPSTTTTREPTKRRPRR